MLLCVLVFIAQKLDTPDKVNTKTRAFNVVSVGFRAAFVLLSLNILSCRS